MWDLFVKYYSLARSDDSVHEAHDDLGMAAVYLDKLVEAYGSIDEVLEKCNTDENEAARKEFEEIARHLYKNHDYDDVRENYKKINEQG